MKIAEFIEQNYNCVNLSSPYTRLEQHTIKPFWADFILNVKFE